MTTETEWTGACFRPDVANGGMAYFVLLVLLVVLTTMGLALMQKVGIDAATGMTRSLNMQAGYLAEAAAHHATWRLLNDPGFPAREDVYYMHSLDGGRYGYKVRRHTDTTFATIATVGIAGQDPPRIVNQSYVLYVKPPNYASFGVYGTTISSGDTIPKSRGYLHRTNVWGTPTRTRTTASAAAQYVELRGCRPHRNEVLLATQDTTRRVSLNVWDGFAWGNSLTFPNLTFSTYKGFDIAYESLTGRAVVVGGNGDDTAPFYTIWNGSSWVYSVPQRIFDIPGSLLRRISMRSKPSSNEILVLLDKENGNLVLLRWDGSAFSNLGTIETAVGFPGQACADMVYEQGTNEAVIVWGHATDAISKYRVWDGSALTATLDLPDLGARAAFVKLAADPVTTRNLVALAVVDVDGDVSFLIWDGNTNSWSASPKLSGNARLCADVSWESSGDQVLAAWSESGSNSMRHLVWRSGEALPTSGNVQSGPSFPVEIRKMRVRPVSGSDQLVVLGADAVGDLYSATWDGNNFGGTPTHLAGDVVNTAPDIGMCQPMGLAETARIIAWWEFEQLAGTTTAKDSTRSHIDGTLKNMDPSTVWVTGKIGTALAFDGANDFVEVPHSDVFLLDEGTVSFWFRANNVSGTKGLISKDSMDYDTGGHLTITLVNNQVRVRLQSTSQSYFLWSPAVTVYTWHHVAFTFGPSGMRLYLNGVSVGSDAYAGGLGATSGGIGNHEPMAIGADTARSGDRTTNGWDNPFSGRIDDVRVYDRALSGYEVNALFSSA